MTHDSFDFRGNRKNKHEEFTSNRFRGRRIWWFITIVTSLSICSYFIYRVYQKWDKNPITVSLATNETSIMNIPFPAITVCPESKIDKDKFNYSDTLEKGLNYSVELTDEEKKLLKYTYSYCANHKFDWKYRHIHALEEHGGFSEDIYDVIDNVKPKILFEICSLYIMNGPFKNMCKAFVPILTDDGLCYTANILDRQHIFRENVKHYKQYHDTTAALEESKDWSFEDGYKSKYNLEGYPFKAYLSGATYGFTFHIITLKNNGDFFCKSSGDGYRISLHNPLTIPRPSQDFFRISPDRNVMVAVKPDVTITSKKLKKVDPKLRGCYFESERPLKYFKKYTTSNCQLECVTNYTLHGCKCVKYFMPRENGTSICGNYLSFDCPYYAEKIMNYYNVFGEESAKRYIEDAFSEDILQDCDCLPNCAELKYETEVSEGGTMDSNAWMDAFSHEFFLRLPRYYNRSNARVSSVTVFFKSEQFRAKERKELYEGRMDFIMNFGGLFVLFTALIILFLIEFVYFFNHTRMVKNCGYKKCDSNEDF